MHWQDWVLAAGSLLFTVALIPSIRAPHKPALSSSVMTAVVLGIFAAVYITLGLWFAAFTTSLTCISWTILGVQEYLRLKTLPKTLK